MLADEPIMDIAHLGHVELLTPRPEESLRFFTEVMGMTVSARQGDSVFLRGWDDYERYSLQLTASHTSGLGHAAFRTRSAQALERRLDALRADGVEVWAEENNIGHGTGWRFRDPDGHVFELYWDTEWYEAPPERRPSLKNQAERYPARGVNVRRIDHFNCLAVDVRACREFFQRNLGLRCTERIELDSGEEAGMWLTANNKSYDFAFTKEAHGVANRFHHVTFALDSREAVLQAADTFLEAGVHIETGPHKHAVQQTFFLYVYEPGGNRVEVAHAGARLILAPDWRTVTWTETERKKGQAWGLKTIESFHIHGTPPLPDLGQES
jgi:catechol 2,3-dioxygenase